VCDDPKEGLKTFARQRASLCAEWSRQEPDRFRVIIISAPQQARRLSGEGEAEMVDSVQAEEYDGPSEAVALRWSSLLKPREITRRSIY
jgi:hypothetical protein